MAFEDLQRAPASKLFPLVRVLLQADSLTETDDAATLSALALGKVGLRRGLSLTGGSVWGSLQQPSCCWTPRWIPATGMTGLCGPSRVLPRCASGVL